MSTVHDDSPVSQFQAHFHTLRHCLADQNRRQLMADDLFAGKSVACVLGAIVAGGALLMLGTVLVIVW
jgi:hypothetical protein